jgi:hypothetical protein
VREEAELVDQSGRHRLRSFQDAAHRNPPSTPVSEKRRSRLSAEGTLLNQVEAPSQLPRLSSCLVHGNHVEYQRRGSSCSQVARLWGNVEAVEKESVAPGPVQFESDLRKSLYSFFLGPSRVIQKFRFGRIFLKTCTIIVES